MKSCVSDNILTHILFGPAGQKIATKDLPYNIYTPARLSF